MSIILLIRYADYEDIPEVMSIQNQVWTSPEDITDEEEFKEAVEDELLYICQINNKIVGYALCYLEYDNIHIQDITVLPDYQNKGYGTQLIQFIMDDSTKDITLSVFINNTGAIKLYKKLGFEIVETKHYMKLTRGLYDGD